MFNSNLLLLIKEKFIYPLIFSFYRVDSTKVFIAFPFLFLLGMWIPTSLFALLFVYLIFSEKILKLSIITIPYKILFTILIITGINAALNTGKFLTGIQYFVGTIIVPILLFISIINSNLSLKTISTFIKNNFISGIILGSFSLYIVFILGTINVRLPSLWEDFNILAAYLMILFFFCLTFIIHNKSEFNIYFLFIALFCVFIGIFFTQTRGVWLAIVFSLAIYFLKRPKLLLPASILFGLIIFLFYSIIMDRFLSVKYFSSDISSLGRLQAWLASILIIKQHWLLGAGFDGFLKLRESVMDVYLIAVLHSHNTYLRLWVELGILGFLSYIFFFFLGLYYSFKLLRIYKTNIWGLKIAEGLQLSFIGLAIAFMFEPYFSLYGNSTIIIWVLISITYYLHKFKPQF